MSKICSKCGVLKSLSEFNKHKSTTDKHRPECKKCQGDAYKLWGKNNTNKIMGNTRKSMLKIQYNMSIETYLDWTLS